MTIVRIDPPPPPKKKFWPAAINFAFDAAKLLTAGPAQLLADKAIATAQAQPWKDDKYRPFIATEYDTDTGKVTLDSSTIVTNRDWQRLANNYGRQITALQLVADTGQIAPGLDRAYRPAAEAILANRSKPLPETPPVAIIPPGGYAGFSQMTPASKLALNGGLLRSVKRYAGGKRKRKAKASGGKRKKRASGKRRGKKLVKGSAAAKRFMANLRRKRK